MRDRKDGRGLRALGFGCLAAALILAIVAAALWVIFAWGVNQA